MNEAAQCKQTIREEEHVEERKGRKINERSKGNHVVLSFLSTQHFPLSVSVFPPRVKKSPISLWQQIDVSVVPSCG